MWVSVVCQVHRPQARFVSGYMDRVSNPLRRLASSIGVNFKLYISVFMIKILKTILILLCASLEVHSQYQITAKIIDFETNEPVRDVIISLADKDNTTMSNYLGYFQLMVDTSDYLILEKPFYETGQVKVSTNSRMTILLKKRTEAEYDGGFEEFYQFISQNIKYPANARINGTQGRIYTSFVIDSLGYLEDINLLNDIGNGCGIAVKLVLASLPNYWIPAENKTTFILPVTFKIGNSEIKTNNIELPQGKLLDEVIVTAMSTGK
jgi:hypothetical protein